MYVFPPLSLYFILSEFSTFIHPFIHLFFFSIWILLFYCHNIAIVNDDYVANSCRKRYGVKINIRKISMQCDLADGWSEIKRLCGKILWKILKKLRKNSREGRVPWWGTFSHKKMSWNKKANHSGSFFSSVAWQY